MLNAFMTLLFAVLIPAAAFSTAGRGGMSRVAFTYEQIDGIPWAHPESMKLLQEAQEMGVGEIIAEVQGEVRTDGTVSTKRVNGTIPGINDLQVYIMAARNLKMKAVIKLTSPLQLPEKDFERSMYSFDEFAVYHAKLAQATGAHEIDLPGGILIQSCDKPWLFDGLVNALKKRFHGDIRVDFNGMGEYNRAGSCLRSLTETISGVGVDLPPNPGIADVEEVLQSGAVLSRITFTGKPLDQARHLLGSSFIKPLLGHTYMAFGPFRPNPNVLDQGKPLRREISKWFNQDF